LTADRETFIRLAEGGMAQTRANWWNQQAGWYNGTRGDDANLATLWHSYPLVAATAAVAVSRGASAMAITFAPSTNVVKSFSRRVLTVQYVPESSPPDSIGHDSAPAAAISMH